MCNFIKCHCALARKQKIFQIICRTIHGFITQTRRTVGKTFRRSLKMESFFFKNIEAISRINASDEFVKYFVTEKYNFYQLSLLNKYH